MFVSEKKDVEISATVAARLGEDRPECNRPCQPSCQPRGVADRVNVGNLRFSDQSLGLQTDAAVSSDNDVVVHHDSQQAPGLGNPLGNLDIGAAGFR